MGGEMRFPLSGVGVIQRGSAKEYPHCWVKLIRWSNYMSHTYLYGTFSQQYREAVDHIIGSLAQPRRSFIGLFSARIGGERIVAPDRIYYRYDRSTLHTGDTVQAQVAACLFSRHHNGHVREECLRSLLEHTEPPLFVIPYILKLAEEYVLALVELVRKHLARLPEENLARFLKENPKWLPLMYQRCASYWDCYYRRYPRLEDYPGMRLIAELKQVVTKQRVDTDRRKTGNP